MGIAIDEAGALGIQRGTFRVADPWIDATRRVFAGAGYLCCCIGIDFPGVEQVEIRHVARHQCGIREAGRRVFGGVPGNPACGGDSLANRRVAQIGGVGRAFTLTKVHRDPQSVVAGVFDGLGLTQAHRYRQPGLGRHAGLRGICTKPARLLQQVLYDLCELGYLFGFTHLEGVLKRRCRQRSVDRSSGWVGRRQPGRSGLLCRRCRRRCRVPGHHRPC